jgi:hypothetical protein
VHTIGLNQDIYKQMMGAGSRLGENNKGGSMFAKQFYNEHTHNKDILPKELSQAVCHVATWAMQNHKYGPDPCNGQAFSFDRIRIFDAYPMYSEDAMDRLIELSNINLKYVSSKQRVIRLGLKSICATTVEQLQLLTKNTGKIGDELLFIKTGDMNNEDIKQYLDVPDWW